jgi:hypothetical protein
MGRAVSGAWTTRAEALFIKAKRMVQPVFTSVAKFPGRVAAVMPDEVDVEIAGRFLDVFDPDNDGDSAVKEADGPGSRGSVEFHP